MGELERKSTLLEVKDIDVKQGIFTGYFSSFGTVDSYNDVVDFGAFAKTFKALGPAGKNRIKCAYQHNPFGALLGKPLKLEEQTFGAYHETKVSMTSYGKDVLLLMEDGVLTEQSFSFETISAIAANKSPDGHRHLVEVKCWEYGPQTWGANESTPITGVKAPDLMQRMQRLDKHLKSGNLSDESLVALLTQTMDLWGKALEEIKAQPPLASEPEVIVVQTPASPPAEAPKADPETGGNKLEQKSMNGVLSFEETISHVWEVVRMIERIPYSDGDGTYARYYLMETYPDLALVEESRTDKYFTIPWVRDAAGKVTLGGELTEVVKTYTPAQKAASMASLLRAMTKCGGNELESKAGARNSTADAAAIRDIHKMARGLMDKPQQCKAMSEDLCDNMTQDDMTMVMGLVDESHKAMILAACQPEAGPSKSHPGPTTDNGGAEGPAPSHPDVTAQSLKRRQRELELLEMETPV